MEPAIMKGFEMGTHMIPVTLESPLCRIFWACLLLGVGVQILLQRKRGLRFVWPVLLLVALVGCEMACQTVTGWDLILWVILHFYLLTALTGALLGMAHRCIRQRKGAL